MAVIGDEGCCDRLKQAALVGYPLWDYKEAAWPYSVSLITQQCSPGLLIVVLQNWAQERFLLGGLSVPNFSSVG